MKRFSIINISIIIATLLIAGCSKDDYPVPEASSQAEFSYTYQYVDNETEEGEKLFEVSFINESINASSYHWDFGDGRESTEENPVITFADEGDIDVTLTITSDTDYHYNDLTQTQTIRVIFKETIYIETFDEEESLENFSLHDADGDGTNWYWDSFEGEAYVISESWDGAALTPDNWIVTPEIDFSEFSGDSEIWLNFKVCPTANTPEYRTEHYAVYVSTTGFETDDFDPENPVWEETLSEEAENWVYDLREIDFSDFAGETIWVAFRHYNSTDNDRISIDDIEVFEKF